MSNLRIGKDVILTIASLIIGIIVGIAVSNYFYEKSRIDFRESLINAAMNDVEGYRSEASYPELHDSVKSADSGQPWPKLSLSGIKELSRKIHSFKHSENFEALRFQVSECKREVEEFNDRLFLRNLSIVTALSVPGLTAEMSPLAYHHFQSEVLPIADSLLILLKQNKSRLLGD